MKRFVLLILLLAACSPQPAPVSTPQPQAQPPRSPNALTPVAAMSKSIAEPRIRVGLLSDQRTVTFPRIEGGYYIVDDKGAAQTLRRGFTDTAPLSSPAAVHYAVQVSSISDFASVTSFVERLRTETGQRVDAIFDPASGFYRILVGDLADAKSAEPLRDDLTQRGYGKDMMIVRRSADQQFAKQHQLVDDEGESYTIDGDSILVLPVTAETIVIDAKPYRTAARVWINARGQFNVINELNLEEYLRGVVPAEMGPKIFDEVEALKAQAIAARTYAVRNLGQFRREGYDICPGPACQAYLGFSGEDPLSDRAVKETAGLVASYQGQLIDALYTATCGGETSDVGVMFPGRHEPYLKRARCVEMEMTSLAGRGDSGLLTEHQVNGRLFAAAAGLPDTSASWSAAEVLRAIDAAVGLLRYEGTISRPVPPDHVLAMASAPAAGAVPQRLVRPASSRRGDVLTYLAVRLSFDDDARVLTLPEDRKYFFPQTADPEATAYLAAAFLVKFGFLPAQYIDRLDLRAAMPREELYGLLGSWLRKHGGLSEVTGKISAVSGRRLTLKAEGKNTTFTLPDGIPIFRRLVDRWQEYKTVPVMIGDRAFLQLDGRKTPVALIVQANIDGASFDRTSSFANWTRSYTAEELVASINKRNPIRELVDLRPRGVDASGRITELEVTAEGGRTFTLKGLPIRWSLNVPDNLFVFDKTKDANGGDRYTFFGKGWGHGVGLCQVGAYGMAFRGWTYEQILKRYYTGIEIGPMAPASSPPR
jgi:stage II sporulation protein D